MMTSNSDSSAAGSIDTHTTELLLQRIRNGEDAAREELLRRMLPPFERWAQGRLPNAARGAVDTADLVQVTLIRAIRRAEHFESGHPGAFFGYLRRIMLNAIRETVEKEVGRGQLIAGDEIANALIDSGSLLEHTVGRDNLIAYEQALAQLPAEHQSLVMMRFEFGMSFVEIATELGESADGVRIKLNRALKKMIITLDQ
jgi:RNA polymerase sigma factor (sigma-70 family)